MVLVSMSKNVIFYGQFDILEKLNGNSLSEESTFVSIFDTELSLSLFYRFLKMDKQYIYHVRT